MLQQRNLKHKSRKNWKQNLGEQRLLLKLQAKKSKKTTSIIKDSSNSNNEVSFPPSE